MQFVSSIFILNSTRDLVNLRHPVAFITCDYVAKLLSDPLACSWCCKNLWHENFETVSCNITLWLASKYRVSFEVLVLIFDIIRQQG